MTAGELRQVHDGWHAVLNLRSVEHRIWIKEAPLIAEAYAVELQLDRDFDFRAHAARRLWRVMNNRPPGPPLHVFSAQRRRRLALALRALDARADGSTYREIAEVLFGARQIPERAWKTHDLRNRTIRLVQTGVALMRGGYRALLRPPARKNRQVAGYRKPISRSSASPFAGPLRDRTRQRAAVRVGAPDDHGA